MTLKNTLAFSYIRFSSKRQMKGDSHRRQVSLAEQYCTDNGLSLSTSNFEDLGVSAWTGKNTEQDSGLGQFFEAVKSGAIPKGSYLLVESLDRLSRQKVQFALTQMLEIVNAGITLVTLMDNQVYKTPVDTTQLIISITVMERSHNESETKSKRLKSVWANKRSNPDTTNRTAKAPFWLSLNSDKRSYTVIEQHKRTVEKIYDMAIAGYGVLRIAKALNNEGVLTVTGKKWQEGTVYAVLGGKQVLGIYHPHIREGNKRVGVREEIPNYYPAIVSEETWLLAQARLNERKKIGGGRQGSNKNVFLGSSKCAKCGSNMILAHKTDSWLMCKNRLVNECDNAPIRLDVAYQWLKEHFISPMFNDALFTPQRQSNSDELEVMRAKMKSEEEALQGLLQATKDFSNPIVLQEVQRRSEELQGLSEEIKQLELQQVSDNSPKLSMEETRKMLDLSMSPESGDDNIRARLMIKRLIGKSFRTFEMLHSDKIVSFKIELNDNPMTVVFESLKDSTKSLKHLGDGQLWRIGDYIPF